MKVLCVGEDRKIVDFTTQTQGVVCLVMGDCFCQSDMFSVAKMGMSNSDDLAIVGTSCYQMLLFMFENSLQRWIFNSCPGVYIKAS